MLNTPHFQFSIFEMITVIFSRRISTRESPFITLSLTENDFWWTIKTWEKQANIFNVLKACCSCRTSCGLVAKPRTFLFCQSDGTCVRIYSQMHSSDNQGLIEAVKRLKRDLGVLVTIWWPAYQVNNIVSGDKLRANWRTPILQSQVILSAFYCKDDYSCILLNIY